MTRWNMDAINALYGSGKPPKARSRKVGSKVGGKVESERRAQQRLVKWMIDNDILHYAIPNGANVAPHHRSVLRSEGLSPGVPDLCIPLARRGYHALYIELKRADGGSGLSEAQEVWIARLIAERYHAVCCHGFDEARRVVSWYVGIDE